jgi:predicted N-acetyltransferase YhbS
LTKDLLDDPTARPLISLLAFEDDRVSGHVLFTRARVSGSDLIVSILAPLAVLPECQGKGVGTALVNKGLEMLKERNTDLVFVLGHPGYYPRFGFLPAGERGFRAPYPIPGKDAGAWMVLELQDGTIGSVKGTVICADALDRPEHWRE